MRRFLLLWICFTLFNINGHTQTPTIGINYQAVARNENGEELVQEWLDVKFSILSNAPNGTLVWEELHTDVQTNDFGLFTLVIGKGLRTGGSDTSFASIKWGSKPHFLNVKVKLDQDFIDLGSTQLNWVPYALYALNAGSGGGTANITYNSQTHKLYANSELVADLSDLYTDGSDAVQNMSLEGNNINFTKSDQTYKVDLSKFLDNTDSQTLSTSGNTLSISGGNAVNFDSDATNEIQVLSLDGNVLKIHRPGSQQIDGSIALPDLYEEYDSLFIKGYAKPNKISLKNTLSVPGKNQLSISRGNTVCLDTDTANEIQDLTLVNNILKITRKPGATAIDLAPYKDNTDNQAISRVGNAIQISGNASTVDISDMINIPWVAFSANNLSNQALLGSAETLITWSEEFDDGNCLYNNSFIAPTEGTYSLSLTIFLYSASDNLTVRIYKNNTTTLLRSFSGFGKALSHNMLLKLNSGDNITVRINSTAQVTLYMESGYFSGYRVK
jgi:hypothetical protein